MLSAEEAICKDESLAKLDVEMAAAYRKRRESATPSDKSQLVQSQQKWLVIRNSYNANPYHGDPAGVRSDLAAFYRSRIAALGSRQKALLDTELPKEYEWLMATAPEGFERGLSIGRAYMSCEGPCKQKPLLYRWLSIGGSGIGEEPGDVDTPFAEIAKKLASEGWIVCRSADDSGKPTVDYFRKNDKMAAVTRYYSMGAGNSIGFGITISGPLPQDPLKPPPNPAVVVTSDWNTYSSPDVGLQLRYPPGWGVRADGTPGSGTKYLSFGAKDYTGNFRISMQPEEKVNHEPININNEDPAPKCIRSSYRVSGFPAQECLFEGENVGDGTCNRYVEFVDVETGGYRLLFEPVVWGSVPDDSGGYRLTDLYEKILDTIELR
jgi:hypothetical protein